MTSLLQNFSTVMMLAVSYTHLHPREDYTKRLIAAIPTRNRKEGPQ